MDLEPETTPSKGIKTLAWTNIVLLGGTNFIVYSTWYRFVFGGGDTMFVGGLILVFLFMMSVYYLILLNWGVRLLRNIDDPLKNIKTQSFILFFLNILPIFSFFFLGDLIVLLFNLFTKHP